MAEVNNYNKLFSKTPHLFGEEPDKYLKKHVHLLNNSSPVLDVACAQGRNSFFLARKGFDVVSIDPSEVAIDGIRKTAKDENLSINCFQTVLEDFDAEKESFGTIIVFGLFQMLEMHSILEAINKLKSLLITNGYIFISAWTVDDSSYDKSRETGIELTPHSFQLPEGHIRTYLKPHQLAELFKEMETIYYWEGEGDWHSHGDSPPEQHARVEAVFKK